MEYTIRQHSSSDPWDDLWNETRGTELEAEEDDECDYEMMDDEPEDY